MPFTDVLVEHSVYCGMRLLCPARWSWWKRFS